jgi:DNA-binding NtrC family response regulator
VPLEVAPAAPAPPVTADLHGTETILVVEDEDTVRTLTANVLKNAGYVVIEASGPAAALKMAERSASTIHLLLSDVIMPGFDGVELSKRFRKSHPQTPVLFMSGYSDDTMAHHGLTVDQYKLLTKPFTTTNLLLKVREALGQQAN